jgi:hypothetical protein
VLKIANFFEATRLCKIWASILRPYCGFFINEEFEEKINLYRLFNTNIDGYDICMYCVEYQVEEYIVKTVQIFSKKSMTLPFHIVYKTALEILGNSKSNIFFSFIRQGTTVFCWTKVETIDGEDASIVQEEVQIKKYMGNTFAFISD